jgi:uncharacterized protein YbaP (TraB family)
MIRLLQLLAVAVLVLSGPARADAPAMPFADGLLFRLDKAGVRPGYLFGTMHVGDRDVLDLPEPVRTAFGAARNVALEIVWDGAAAEYMTSAMRLPEGQLLADLVGPELYDAVVARARGMGLAAGDIDGLRPWALSLFLGEGIAEVRSASHHGRYLDEWLRHEAGADGKMLYSLERPAEHLAPFDQMSDAQERQMLLSVLNDADAEARYKQMKAMYLDGDLAGLAGLMDLGPSPAERDLAAALHRHLIVERNIKMAARLDALLAKGDMFAAVGALHLPGEQGMLRLLEARGYQVTRVY